MIKINYIPNKKNFLELICSCTGDVRVHFANGATACLNQNPALLGLFEAMELGRNGLDLDFSEPKDALSFLRYLMEAAHEERAC